MRETRYAGVIPFLCAMMDGIPILVSLHCLRFSLPIFIPWWSFFQTDRNSIYLINTRTRSLQHCARGRKHVVLWAGQWQWATSRQGSRGHLQLLRQSWFRGFLISPKAPDQHKGLAPSDKEHLVKEGALKFRCKHICFFDHFNWD